MYTGGKLNLKKINLKSIDSSSVVGELTKAWMFPDWFFFSSQLKKEATYQLIIKVRGELLEF